MITAFDFFCGAGGSSTGMVKAGATVIGAANHWALAIDTHNTNHPNTEHFLDDIQATHPSQFPRADIAWMSPECTNHSIAKGKKRKNLGQLDLWNDTGIDPSEERSRATMREVVEFSAYHRYDMVIVENVVDIRSWQHYDTWITAMTNMGYSHKVLYINSQFFGVPQSRDRYYAVFWRNGIPAPDLDFRPIATCPKHGQVNAIQSFKKPDFRWGRYGKNRQYVYRCPHCAESVHPAHTPASTAIDWDIKGVKIGERAKPLKDKTMARIRIGIERFARPFTLPYANGDGPARPTTEPLHTIATSHNSPVIVPPFLTVLKNSAQNGYNQPSIPIDNPLTTIVASASQHGLVVPPFIASYYNNPVFAELSTPMPTVTSREHHALITPVIGNMEDILNESEFRMLTAKELKAGMSFPTDYTVLGNRADQIRQIGNAVCCNVAEWITRQCIKSLEVSA